MVALMKSRSSSNMGCHGSKTRSLGQIKEKPCVCDRGGIFQLIFMNIGQNDNLDKI